MVNYQKELDTLLASLGDRRPSLLLHSCCGPCSSYVITYLNSFFDITVLYFNPSIYPESEYLHRKEVQLDLISKINASASHKVSFIDSDYDHNAFLQVAAGHEWDPECGERCHNCYRQRLSEAGRVAAEGGFDFFCTTLSVSPYKNATVLNEIGSEISALCGVAWLPSDFKKKEGYKRSIELSKVYDLYRQDYCGCEFSMSNRLSE
ncbi:MAG: epoxyqueuosine reductase QueH [Clostridia bacterium]|nr:epoxyqueuosine reductase QueH [Clostridia bacterium]